VIVIADTSVILNLCQIRHEGLLQQLYSRVIVPTEVATEFVQLSTMRSAFRRIGIPKLDRNCRCP
jgi:predicted nucleic acid-binding protein